MDGQKRALPSSFLFVAMKISPTVIMKREVPGLSERALTEFVSKARRAAGLRGTVTVLLTSSREMRGLNGRFRGKDSITDVLSFPSPSFLEGFAGDVAISLDVAGRNARALGHSVANEVKILVLHGVLHLAGYDHEGDDGEMAAKESRLRRRLGLPAALIERAALKRPTTARSARLRT
jgi:probable rRNA maturation factor